MIIIPDNALTKPIEAASGTVANVLSVSATPQNNELCLNLL